MAVIALYTSYQGRIGRLTFLLGSMPFWILAIVVQLTIPDELTVVILLALGSWLLTWPLSVKRAHDLNKSGWWCFGWYVAALLSVVMYFVAAAVMVFEPVTGALSFLGCLVFSCVVLYQTFIKMFFFSGTVGPNDYGHPPRMVQELFGDKDEMGSEPTSARVSWNKNTDTPPAAPRTTIKPRSNSAPSPGFGRRA